MSQANTILSEEDLSLVTDCAARLRVIQGDAAAIDAEKRREYLSEEVNRSFKGLPTARRKSCLDSLLARFPVAGQLAKNQTAPSAPVTAPVAETPEKLLERLLSVAGELSAAQLQEFGRRLAEAGMVPAGAAANYELSLDAKTRLGLSADQQPDAERLAVLATLVVQSLADLDRTGISVLKELYPRSSFLNRPYDFRKTAGQYLTGGVEKIEPHLRVTSALLGGMLAALLGGGRDFARQYVEKFSPGAIEDVVVAEGRSSDFMGPSKKERCWDKYSNLSKDVATPELMDRWLKDSLGRFIESGIKNVR